MSRRLLDSPSLVHNYTHAINWIHALCVLSSYLCPLTSLFVNISGLIVYFYYFHTIEAYASILLCTSEFRSLLTQLVFAISIDGRTIHYY